MKTKRDNRIILDINKCVFARFYYRNQWGHTANATAPEHLEAGCYFSVRGEWYEESRQAHYHPDFPDETLKERAIRLGMLDVWTPETYFQIQAGTGVIYTGDKAVSMYAAWNAKIFGKKK